MSEFGEEIFLLSGMAMPLHSPLGSLSGVGAAKIATVTAMPVVITLNLKNIERQTWRSRNITRLKYVGMHHVQDITRIKQADGMFQLDHQSQSVATISLVTR
jgi:hypothetical protein